jgi:hypothetical protein
MKQNPLNPSRLFFLGIAFLSLVTAHAHAAEIAIARGVERSLSV